MNQATDACARDGGSSQWQDEVDRASQKYDEMLGRLRALLPQEDELFLDLDRLVGAYPVAVGDLAAYQKGRKIYELIVGAEW